MNRCGTDCCVITSTATAFDRCGARRLTTRRAASRRVIDVLAPILRTARRHRLPFSPCSKPAMDGASARGDCHIDLAPPRQAAASRRIHPDCLHPERHCRTARRPARRNVLTENESGLPPLALCALTLALRSWSGDGDDGSGSSGRKAVPPDAIRRSAALAGRDADMPAPSLAGSETLPSRGFDSGFSRCACMSLCGAMFHNGWLHELHLYSATSATATSDDM